MKMLLAIAAVAVLGACAHNSQCVQPDPVEPSHRACWDKGVNCGQKIQPTKGN